MLKKYTRSQCSENQNINIQKEEGKNTKTPKIGIALGSGGARGIAHIQFLKVFDELGIKPYMIAGCSIGSLIGALYCAGSKTQDIENYFLNLKQKDINSLTDLTVNKSGFIKGDKAIQELSKKLKCKKFKDLKIPLKIVATDFYDGKSIIFNKGNILKAVRASSSIPGIFVPVDYKNKILIDGGIVNPVPYDLLLKECDFVIAVNVVEGTFSNKRKESKRKKEMPIVHELIFNTYEIVQLNIINNMLETNPPDIYIKPDVSKFNMMEFTRAKEILEAVKHDVISFKKELKKIL
jgi:NTE family protein